MSTRIKTFSIEKNLIYLFLRLVRSFDYSTIQNKLIEELYSSTAPSSNLTCADTSGASIPCSDGFCRAILDGNGFVTYPSCVKKGSATPSYGLTLTKVKLADFGDEQISIMYACNTPMCNSKDNSNQVLKNLVDAQLIPQFITTTPLMTSTATSSMTSATTSSMTSATTGHSTGVKMMSNKQILIVLSLFLFSLI